MVDTSVLRGRLAYRLALGTGGLGVAVWQVAGRVSIKDAGKDAGGQLRGCGELIWGQCMTRRASIAPVATLENLAFLAPASEYSRHALSIRS